MKLNESKLANCEAKHNELVKEWHTLKKLYANENNVDRANIPSFFYGLN